MTGPSVTGPGGTRRVLVDTDTGIDDALALLWLSAQPDVEIVGITAVYGNCVVDDALRNIGHVLGLVGLDHVPVARGAEGPLEAEAHIAHYVHGHDGLGDVVADRPLPRVLLDATAAERLVEVARASPGEIDLLTLGPLTNVALALRAEPRLLTLFRSVTIMGGSGPFPELGRTDMVDANVQNDGPAAREVFTAPAGSRLMVGVNATSQVITDESHVAALRDSGTPTGTFAADVLATYLDFYRNAWGRRVSPVHDGLAAALMVHPEWIAESVTGPVGVTHDGFATRGRVLVTPDGAATDWRPDGSAPDDDPSTHTTAVTAVRTDLFLPSFVDALIHGARS
ncbi:nucleoside hydrolase [Frigoribacterium sp. Leaf186]|uniref:nucleoside hydrolase n=1 Tax=Frigoribacterium sp. Leaf186 TaxID=1736293 RepID=UPI00138EFB58|nr:nucleoside hydrolase [Frigoribacterium sp. Leaf186]